MSGGGFPGLLKSAIKRVWLSGGRRHCPVCDGWARRFLGFGTPPRPEARCPWCHSLERHRLVWRYFELSTDLFDGRPKKVLHVAPERCLEPRLRRRLGDGYLTADLRDPTAMEQMDITDIRHPDSSFDTVYCSHVLEHVPDDRKAMAELRRVLKPSGWALILVPIFGDTTVEDPSITDPGERLESYGHPDHVRIYGADYIDRLRDAGFAVEHLRAADFLDPTEVERLAVGTVSAGDIFHCTKVDSARSEAEKEP
jgi:SAM-dependent methyltransferase